MPHKPPDRLVTIGVPLVLVILGTAAFLSVLHLASPSTRPAGPLQVATTLPGTAANAHGEESPPPLATTGAAATDQLEIIAEDDAGLWSRQDGTGQANDVVRAAFAAAGVSVRLIVVPYARAKSMTVAGRAVGCFSMSWEPVLEGKVVFSDKPLLTCYVEYFHHQDRPLRAKAEDQINEKIVVGVAAGYEYPASLYRLRDKGLVVLYESPSEELNLKKLEAGRVDAAIINLNDATKPVEYMRAKAGVGEKVAPAFRSGEMGSYIGFSTKHPRGAWALAKFNAGFQAIESDGTLRRIEEQWSRTARVETQRLLQPVARP